jgi:regulator of sigma E protease
MTFPFPKLVLSLAFLPAALLLAGSSLQGWGLAALMLGTLIFLHELGHFVVAKWMGMPVEVFSLGFGPRLLGFKWRETDVRLSVLPLGGYVKLAGFNPEEPEAEDPHGFLQQPTWKRVLFFSGGILANIATAFVLLTFLGVHSARMKPTTLKVMEIVKGSAAEAGGLQLQDDLKRIGPLPMPETPWEEAVAYIQARPGQSIPFQVQRAGASVALDLVPRNENGVGKIGIRPQAGDFVKADRPLSLADLRDGLRIGALQTWGLGGEVLKGYVRLFTFRANLKELGGPIAIARAGRDAAQAGWFAYFLITAMISLNLAILNALPIPFLDGGHVTMLLFEKARGRDLSIAVKERILTGGAIFLVAVMVLVFAMDLWKLRH